MALRTKIALSLAVIRTRPDGVSTREHVKALRDNVTANADPFGDTVAVLVTEQELFGLGQPTQAAENQSYSSASRDVDVPPVDGSGSPLGGEDSQLAADRDCTQNSGESSTRPNNDIPTFTTSSQPRMDVADDPASSQLDTESSPSAQRQPPVSSSGCASLQFLQSVTRLQRAVTGGHPPPTDADLDTATDTVLRHVIAAATGPQPVWLSLHHGLELVCRALTTCPHLLTVARPTVLNLLERLLESVLSARDLHQQTAQQQQSRLLLLLGSVPRLAAPLLTRLTARLAAAAAQLQQEHRRALLGLPASAAAAANTAMTLENSHYTLTMLERLLQSAGSGGDPLWPAAVRSLQAELERASLFICDRHPAFVRFLWRLLRLTQAVRPRSQTPAQFGPTPQTTVSIRR